MVQKAPSRGLEKRRAILLAAARLFRAKGFNGTGMRDIAEALGMTVGNLYYYFEGKVALLAFCQEQAAGRLRSLARWAASQQHLEAEARLYALIVGHVTCLNEALPGSLAHMEVEELTAAHRARVQALRDDYERALRDLIEDGIDRGRFREGDAKVAALAILGAVNWTVKWYRPDGELSVREIGQRFAEQLVRGLLAAPNEFVAPSLEIPIFDADDDALLTAGRE